MSLSDRISDCKFDGFMVKINLDGQWVITKGTIITNKNEEFILQENYITSFQQIPQTWSYVYLSKKSKVPNPEFLCSSNQPVFKNKMWVYNGHICLGIIPPLEHSVLCEEITNVFKIELKSLKK
jgi:hypothetical protein